ncbi:hypothetical protein PAMP_011066 [Pampus punctatissimus]
MNAKGLQRHCEGKLTLRSSVRVSCALKPLTQCPSHRDSTVRPLAISLGI